MRNKVLIVSTYAGIPRVRKFAQTLSPKYDVTIYEWDRNNELSKYEILDGVKIVRFCKKAPVGLGLARLYPSWAFSLIWFSLRYRFDIIIPQNLDTLYPTWLIAKLRRVKVLYDIADFFSEAYIPSKFVSLRRIAAWIERFLIRRVDATIIVDPARLEQLGNVENKPIVVIYNSPTDRPDLAKDKLHIEKEGLFNIFYGGIISPDRGLFMLVDIVQSLTNVKLVVAGFGEKEKEFRSYVEGKSNILFLGKVTHDRVVELTNSSDCVVALYDPSIPNNVFASPNKVFEAMMCGKPLIVSAGSSMSKMITEEECGIVVDYGNPVEISMAIQTLESDPTLVRKLGQNARKAYINKYNWELMRKRLCDLADTVSNLGPTIKNPK